MRVVLYAEMLKETENEQTRIFCHIFIIDGISIGEAGSLEPTFGYVYDCSFMLFYDIKMLSAFLLVCMLKRR